ncbi:MAG: FGGY-family carbohydrate kinase [Alistipes sp.]
MNYYIGLDNGSTLTKAALYTALGEEIAVCSAATETSIPHPGYAERDMEQMWQTSCEVLRQLVIQTHVDATDIRAIGCCGHGKGLYLWGHNGVPVRAGISSTDNRARDYARRWIEDGTATAAFAFSCQKILACQPVSLLAWLRDHEPENFANIHWVFECKDYIRFRLTGEAYAEITDYSGTNLMNLHTRDYDMRLLKLFGLEQVAEMLPPLKLSTDVCGCITTETAALTGLKAGTPVVGGMFDIDACAVAVDATHEESMCMIAGTWSINEYVSREPVLDGSVMMNSLFCQPEYYLIEECSPTSAGNVEWFVNTMAPELKAHCREGGSSVYEQLNMLAGSLAAEEPCPIFLPFLMGSNEHPDAKAAFVGIDAGQGRAHLIRGLYEGVAFSHRRHFDRLKASRHTPVKVIRLAGGITNSTVWIQIFADVMQCPIEIVDIAETGALGCAMAAAVGVGEYPDFAAAATGMVKVRCRVEPIEEHIRIYEYKYALYRHTVEALELVWMQMRRGTQDVK